MTVDEFVATRLDPLLRFARALTGDRGTAEDLVQDVAERLLRRPERVERIADLDAYARRMVVNGYLSWGRKWFRVTPVADLPDRGWAPDPQDGVLESDALRQRLNKLPRRQRAVVTMRFLLDLDDRRIAAELGCSEGTVRSHLSRALHALRVDAALLKEVSPVD